MLLSAPAGMQSLLSDYYGYDPTLQLRRSLAITGYPGLKFRALAYELAALTGIPLVDVDRWEHGVLPHPSLPDPLAHCQELSPLLAARAESLRHADRRLVLDHEPGREAIEQLHLALRDLAEER